MPTAPALSEVSSRESRALFTGLPRFRSGLGRSFTADTADRGARLAAPALPFPARIHVERKITDGQSAAGASWRQEDREALAGRRFSLVSRLRTTASRLCVINPSG